MALNPDMIDPEGDMFLHLSSNPLDPVQVVRVSSKVLSLASPVFKAMLGPNSNIQEAQWLRDGNNKSPAIHLQGDNLKALLVVLQVAHLSVPMLPEKMKIDEFYELAIVCDKYDMAKVLVPWAKLWVCPEEYADDDTDLRWLVIAWVFRLEMKFHDITRLLMLETCLDEDKCLILYDAPVEHKLIPERVIEAIRLGRLRALSTLYREAHECLEVYTKAFLDGLNICNVPTGLEPPFPADICQNRNACDFITAGSILRSLAYLGWFPTEIEGDERSCLDISQALLEEPTVGLATLAMEAASSHRCCLYKGELRSMIDGQREDWKGLVLSEFMSKELLFFPAEY